MSREGRVVGGAERVEDKRKRQAAKAVTAARGSGGGSRGVIAGVAIVVVLAVVVGGGIWLQHHNKNKASALPVAIPVAAAGVKYRVAEQGDTIVTGNLHAPVTIDIYEDFMCPVCGQFEKLYHQGLAQAAADGKAKVVYHPVAILNDYSVPPGYSKLAAGATLCAAQAGIFPRFHDSLFDAQPTEDGPGWTSAQLQQLGRSLGGGDGFTRCVQSGAQQQHVTTATENASRYISGLRSDHQFGTPSVLVNGKLIDISNAGWLEQALNGSRH